MYLLICVLGFYMGFHVEQAELSKAADPQGYQSAIAFSQILFWIMAVLVGTVQGGVQAISARTSASWCPRSGPMNFWVLRYLR